MPVGKYFRGLTTFDLLGNLLPGVVGLLAILGLLPSPPIPDSVGDYGLFAVLAFSLGMFVQYHASAATGERQTFEMTMEGVERLEGLATEGEASNEEENVGNSHNGEKDICQRIPSLFQGLAHAFFDPIFWHLRSPRGRELDDVILTNRIWNHLVDTHEIPPDTEALHVLYHLMSSRVDDVGTPSRAVRFQVLRNFNRGMWVASWYVLVALCIAWILDGFLEGGVTLYAGFVYQQPAFFDYWTPAWHLVIVTSVAVWGFWTLSESYEEDYIEYLFSDYAVAIADND